MTCLAAVLILAGSLQTQQTGELKSSGPTSAPDGAKVYVVEAGTKILLSLSSTVSTKTAAVGDRIYLETAFPIVQDAKVIIPAGSFVSGTVTGVKRPGRVKGRAELYLRFDSLILPSGVTRDFRATVGSIDGGQGEDLDKTEGKISGEGNKSGDAVKVGEAAGWGTAVGGIATQSAGGAGIGAAAGAAAGLVGVLLTRGPDAVLERGSTMEMVLDRNVRFTEEELARANSAGRSSVFPEQQQKKPSGWMGRQ